MDESLFWELMNYSIRGSVTDFELGIVLGNSMRNRIDNLVVVGKIERRSLKKSVFTQVFGLLASIRTCLQTLEFLER